MKGKKFTRKAWKRFVRILSCLVVFCTTYALILPAITAQATSYCGLEEHTHSDECYTEHLECELEENEETGHVHSEECYSRELTCGKTPHQHTRICFSNPDADIETAEDWEKTLPTDDELEDLTIREKIVEVAKSQLNTKESEDNFEVDSETEVRGITRYGQWDGEPYEEWSGAFTRFVLTYAGADEDKDEADKFINAEKDIDEWADSLQENEQLLPIDEGKPGDILYIYDEDDDNRLKAGIITEVKDETIKAIIGNWNNKVDTQMIKLDNNNARAVYKAVPDEETDANVFHAKQNDDDNENNLDDKMSVTDEAVKEEQKEEEDSSNDDDIKDDTYDDDDDDLDKSDSDSYLEEGSSEEEITKLIQVNDSTEIAATWKNESFLENDIIFQAKEAQISENQKEAIENQFSEEEQLELSGYDLSFFQRNDQTELEEVEPIGEVKIDIIHKNLEIDDYSLLALLHVKKSGELENVTNRITSEVSEMNIAQDEVEKKDECASISFSSSEFSTYIEVKRAANSGDVVEVRNFNEIASGKYNILQNDLGTDNSGTLNLTGTGTTTVDLNGFSMKKNSSEPMFKVSSGHILKIVNGSDTKATINNNVSSEGNKITVDAWENKIVFPNSNSSYKASDRTTDADGNVDVSNHEAQNISQNWEFSEITGISILENLNGNVIEVYNSGTLETVDIGLRSAGGAGIWMAGEASNGKATLQNTYIIGGKRGIAADNGYVEVLGGAISGNGSLTSAGNGGIAENGAGISINNTGTHVELTSGPSFEIVNGTRKTKPVEIVGNITKNDGTRNNGGGGISVKQGTLDVISAEIVANATYRTEKEGSWATGGGIKGDQGAKINLLSSEAIIRGNFSDNSGGGISLSSSSEANPKTTLIMQDGQIINNVSKLNEGGGLALQAEDSTSKTDGYAIAVLLAGKINGNTTLTKSEWGGGGIFVGHTANLIMPNGAEVRNNTAYGYGGGIAGCSTGKIVVDQAVTVVNNNVGDGTRGTTGEKQYDINFPNKIGLTKDEAHDYFTCFYSSVYGKFSDSELNEVPALWTGNVNGVRVENVSDGWLTSQYCMGLTSMNTNIEETKPLQIKDNYSDMHAGGILINGYMVGGNVQRIYNSDTLNIKANKSLLNKSDHSVAGSAQGFNFVVKDGDGESANILGTATTNSEGSINIPGILASVVDENQKSISYYLEEIPGGSQDIEYDTTAFRIDINVSTTKSTPIDVEYKYTDEDGNELTKHVIVIEYTTVIKDVNILKKDENGSYNPYTFKKNQILLNGDLVNDAEFKADPKYRWEVDLSKSGDETTFTNYKTEKRNVTVRKDWSDGPDLHSSQEISVELWKGIKGDDHANGEKVSEVVLSATNQWTHTWSDQLVAENGSVLEYWVKEVTDVPGYLTEYIVENDGEGSKTIDVTEWKESWVPATSIENDKEYILVDENSDKVLNYPSTGADGYKIWEGDTGTISGSIENSENIKNYSEIGNAAIFKVSNKNVSRGKLLQETRYGNCLVYIQGDCGLQYLKIDSIQDLLGSEISSDGYIKQYRYGNVTDSDYIVYNPNTNQFGTDRILGQNLHKVRLYVHASVPVVSQQTVESHGEIKLIIKNQKINNTLIVNKKSDTNTPLAGAEFGLYLDENCRNLVGTTLITNADGEARFENLSESKYWLREITPPNGYSLPEDSIWEINFVNDLTNLSVEITQEVINKAIPYELPETGGPGTNIITASGAALIVLASCMYKSSRKRNRKEGE